MSRISCSPTYLTPSPTKEPLAAVRGDVAPATTRDSAPRARRRAPARRCRWQRSALSGGAFSASHVLAHQNGQRIHLLAGGASGNPDAHGIGGALALEQPRDDLGGERLETPSAIAEETRDADQEIAEQKHDLVRMAVSDARVDARARVDPRTCMRRRTPRDQGLLLVAGEIMSDLTEEQPVNGPVQFHQLIGVFLLSRWWLLGAKSRGIIGEP